MVKLFTSKLCWPDPPAVMSNMTSEGSAGSNSDSGKKERLLVTSVGPGREGCRMARPEINYVFCANCPNLFGQQSTFFSLPVTCLILLFKGISRVTLEYNGEYIPRIPLLTLWTIKARLENR